MSQENGWLGRAVGSMIRRSVRRRFRNVYWQTDNAALTPPIVFYANHHGWMDGYLMFHLVAKLGLECVDWIEEFDSFPLFASVGGMRFTKGDLFARAKTIRRTILRMRDESRSLVIFPEQTLHRPPDIFPFGRAMEVIASKVPNVKFVPVAIRYVIAMHERPEAWIWVGKAHEFDSLDICGDRLRAQLTTLNEAIGESNTFDVLAGGTPDVNERFDMRRVPHE